MDVRQTLLNFDEYLEKQGAPFDAVIIGGAALVVMGVISRDTADVDFLDPTLPESILKHAANFRKANPGLRLGENWINNGPESLIRDLDKDWRSRLVIVFKGKSLTLRTLGRLDLLKSKLFAYCDRDQDLMDCVALKPTLDELEACFEWVASRDANPDWPKNVIAHFEALKRRLRNG